MNTLIRGIARFVLLAVVVTASSVVVAESYGYRGYHGYGMMGMGGYGMGMGPGYGMMGMGGPGMMGMGPGYGMMGMGSTNMLNLSDAQRDKIYKINEDLHKQMWAIMSANRREHYKMRGQFASGDKVDVSKMLAVHDRMYKSMRQMVEARARAHNAMIDVLTKEQREQLKNWHSGRGYPMGPGGPRGGMPGPGMMMR